MFIDLFVTLRKHKVPCSLRELLDLIALLKKGVVFANVEEFYHLAKIVMVKDEIHYDKFDNAFAEYFEGIQTIDIFDKILPDDWLTKEFEKNLSQEEKDSIAEIDEDFCTIKHDDQIDRFIRVALIQEVIDSEENLD